MEAHRDLFDSFHSFLNYQQKREHSSRRRCIEIVRMRRIENEKNWIRTQLRDFDEMTNLRHDFRKSAKTDGTISVAASDSSKQSGRYGYAQENLAKTATSVNSSISSLTSSTAAHGHHRSLVLLNKQDKSARFCRRCKERNRKFEKHIFM